ncbi:MAG: DEAD/DEAH box helicase [Candidatus Eisenbacteria bacterium]|uniref:DEAD/DEAH box helicase n=1 Tax=Eiseniibacteriota bacterium TaxID=2212470 RepID=A0A7Y2EDY3_UNCEI|nr:DEAD/DEAH box helicase [Candidatus Eisenbacteria bacterium]
MTESNPTAESAPEALPQISLDDLSERMKRGVENLGWDKLMPVQAQSIPYLVQGRDIMIQSQTGSGKTGAFLLPLLDRLDLKKARTQCLVLVPTRELARQVHQEAVVMAHETGLRSVAVYGGVGYGAQLEALEQGAHLVVGTPGRVLDHLLRRSLKLDSLNTLIFDEADRMLSVGFYPDIKAIEPYLPEERSGFMFSATYPPGVQSLAHQFLNNPSILSLSHEMKHAPDTVHLAYEVPRMEKDRCLVRLIEVKNPDSAIIFCNTKAQVKFVTVVLQRFGYDADQLSADLAQRAREKVLERVYEKNLRFLVATDVAARGIDVNDLSHVILYDFPEDPESYIHRTGRTGRAGASGVAISLVDNLERLQVTALAKRYDVPMQFETIPDDEEVQAVVSERVTALLEAKLRKLDRLVRERMERMIPLAKRLGENEGEIDVVAMLIDEYYQKSLHNPPEMPEAPPPSTASPSQKGRNFNRRRSSKRRPRN